VLEIEEEVEGKEEEVKGREELTGTDEARRSIS